MVSRTNKFRGRCRTHGRGHKAGRGAGKRGGRGNAGMNKHRVMTRIKYMPNHWGMHGFNRNPSLRKVNVTCNVCDLEKMERKGVVFLSMMSGKKTSWKNPKMSRTSSDCFFSIKSMPNY